MSVAGVVLAAGLSRRMGGRNKMLVEIDGKPMVRRVVEAALEAGLDPVVVVVGGRADEVGPALRGLPVRLARNARPEDGLSASLRVGIQSLSATADGGSPTAAGDGDIAAAVVLLGDMPWVSADDVRTLVGAFDRARGREICVPTHGGRRGNPVLWGARFFAEMASLRGDVGARELLGRHGASVHEIPLEGDGVLRDVDTPDALSAQTVRA